MKGKAGPGPMAPEDVLAAARRWWTTEIVDIHPGEIRMRGYAIEDLIGRVTYPEMVWLMLRGGEHVLGGHRSRSRLALHTAPASRRLPISAVE